MKKFLLTLVSYLFCSAAFAGTYRTDAITSSDGGPVSFPSGITLPTDAVGGLKSGTAALTLTAGANVAAVVTPVTLKFLQVGNQVCAFGQVSIDPTAGATATAFTLTLPVTRAANFSGTGGAAGHAGILGAAVGSCLATNAAKTVTCNYVSGGTAVELVPVSWCYAATGD